MLRKLTILGPGLLGGSIGLAARHRAVAEQVCVWARRPEAAAQARELGAADTTATDPCAAVHEADLVVLATPIGRMSALADQVADALAPGCLVTDVGSVKYPVVTALTHRLEGRAAFVGSHPMAGSERAGIEAARADLFEQAVCIVTPTETTPAAVVQRAHDFWKALGCSVRTLPPQVHDEIVARVSHLPHLTAAALVNVVAREGAEILGCAGPGFRDSTRVAGGPAEMWTEICLENQQEIRRGLDELIDELGRFREALENADAVELRALLKRAKHYRDEMKFRS